MTTVDSPADRLTRRLADRLGELPEVEAVALGGSRGRGQADADSDIDLYVFTRADIAVSTRAAVVERSGGATRADLGLTYWGPGDEWLDAATGLEVDVVYFDTRWLEAQLERVLRAHEASLGYTTCFWDTVANCQSLYDPRGWLQARQSECRGEYPAELRANIVRVNQPVLRAVLPAYANQLHKAVRRHDLVSVNHRLAALLASYFDIIFAVNRVRHPGEKRLLEHAAARCPSLPVEMAADVEAVLRAGAVAEADLPAQLNRLLDRLDDWLVHEGLPVSGPAP